MTGTPGPLHDVLRRCGATMTERDGRLVAAHFGSPTSEAAVCLSAVGMADRSERATLEAGGAPEVVDQAVDGLAALGGRAWWSRVAPGRAIVRCAPADAPAVQAALGAPGVASVIDLGDEYAAIGLIGPRAEELLAAVGLAPARAPVIVVPEREGRVELLVPAPRGPALWEHLLTAGRPFGVACVGLDALGHLGASERRSHVGARPG